MIAIDGPSASGKGTIASRVARSLGFHYLESGALYRVLALVSLREGTTEEKRLAHLASHMDVEFAGGEVLLEDEDVSDKVRSEPCGVRASEVARLPAVRVALLDRQRAFRRPPGLVADGRDMGTVVFPDATVKIFLTASEEARAARRAAELRAKGVDEATIQAMAADLGRRDAADSSRKTAPLARAADAVAVDTSDMTLEQVIDHVVELVQSRAPRTVAAG